MIAVLRRHLTTIVVAFLTAAITAGGPALAEAVREGFNADQVDGKHAVGAGSTVDNRKGKLVATSAETGRLPNNIIGKAPDSDELDGLSAGAFQRRFKRTVVVGPVGTERENGDALRAALARIPNEGPTQPVPRQSWLIHLEPGAYALGGQPLVMRSWVDIEGSGRDTTIIQCACKTANSLQDGTAGTSAGAVIGADGAQLRSLTVLNVVQDGSAAAYSLRTGSARLSDVVLAARTHEGGLAQNELAAGVWAAGDARLTLHNVAAEGGGSDANAVGVWSVGAIEAAEQPRVTVVNSEATGWYSLGTHQGGEMNVATSKLDGAPVGGPKCVGAYNAQFEPLNAMCITVVD